MAYPFVPGTPLPDLVDRLVRGHGVEDKTSQSGKRYLARKRGDVVYRIYIGDLDPNAVLLPSKVENIIRRLGLDPKDFGFDLDGPDPSADDTEIDS